MPKVRTAQQNHDFWIAQAERYEREAAKTITAVRAQQHLNRAAAAREKAATYLATA